VLRVDMARWLLDATARSLGRITLLKNPCTRESLSNKMEP